MSAKNTIISGITDKNTSSVRKEELEIKNLDSQSIDAGTVFIGGQSNEKCNTCTIGQSPLFDFVGKEDKLTGKMDWLLNSSIGVLSDADIKREMKNGKIIITDFNEKNLNNCSYDFTLGGDGYYLCCDPILTDVGQTYGYSGQFFCPWNADHLKEYWGALRMPELVETPRRAKLLGCNVGDKVIIIPPGCSILAHSHEFMGGRGNITTMIKGKSLMGRVDIDTAVGAGWGDVGYVSRWCIPYHNKSPVASTVLIVGKPMGQIIFLQTGRTEKSYTERGSYQTSDDIKEIMSTWKPSDMLPKVKVVKSS